MAVSIDEVFTPEAVCELTRRRLPETMCVLLVLLLPSLLFGAAELRIQPGVARPGDAVLITVKGADEEPLGHLGEMTLDFLPFPKGFQALVGLPLSVSTGTHFVRIQATVNGEDVELEGALDVREPGFRSSELKVDRKFTSPTRAQRKRAARDQDAFEEAFTRDLAPRTFSGPFRWPRKSSVTATFGDIRLFNGKKQSQHQGIDLDGKMGDPVDAANDGEVVMVRDCYYSGGTVLIHHGENLFTAYFHLSKFLTRAGQRVKAGDRIGLVGKSGRVTGPHLHFGMKVGNRWVDPESVYRLDFE